MVMGVPRIVFLRSNAKEIPIGAVGLIASELSQIPDLIGEMVLYHEHYKRSALNHAQSWNFEHAPLRTVETLTMYQNNLSGLREVA